MEIKGTDGKPMHPVGVVGVITAAPIDHEHSYRVRFPDGYEASLRRHEIVTLRDYQLSGLQQTYSALAEYNLQDCVIYRCVIGSRAYGLDEAGSDTIAAGSTCRPLSCTGRFTACPSNWRTRRTRTATGNCRNSS